MARQERVTFLAIQTAPARFVPGWILIGFTLGLIDVIQTWVGVMVSDCCREANVTYTLFPTFELYLLASLTGSTLLGYVASGRVRTTVLERAPQILALCWMCGKVAIIISNQRLLVG